MPAITPIAEPGVTVIQEFTAASPATSSAVLPAAIIGPAFEVIRAVDGEGVLNSDAYAAAYAQFPLSLLQSAFPDPRGNNDELNFQEASIRAYFYYGNLLTQLDRGDGGPNGSAFLSSLNPVRQAALQSIVNEAAGSWTSGVNIGASFVLAFDIVTESEASKDVIVTLAGLANPLSAAEVVASINTAVGATVASVVGSPGTQSLRIFSPTWGARGNVNVRSTNDLAEIFFGDQDSRRVEGAGFRGQDDGDGDLVTPWIEFYRGQSYVAGVADAFSDLACGLVDSAGAFASSFAMASPMSFAGSGANIPLQAATATRAGDRVHAGGVQVLGAEVVEVQGARFRLGVLNSALSTFAPSGLPSNRVYDNVEVNTLLHGVPFSPRYVWFQAQGLEFGQVSPPPISAALVGPNSGRPAQAAEVQGSFTTPGGSMSLTGKTLIVTYIKNSVTQPQLVLTFATDPGIGGLDAALTALLTAAGVAADFSVTVYSDGTDSHLHISTTNLGDDQSLTVLSTGTANTILGFSSVASTSHTGKDVEFASPATLLSTVDTAFTFTPPALTVTVVDSRGTHALSYGIVAANPVAIGDLVAELEDPDNQIAFDGDIRVCTFANDGTGKLLCTTVESGSSVSLTIGGAAAGASPALGMAGSDSGSSDLSGNTARWQLDGAPQVYETTFSSDSIEDAVDAINFAHLGNVVASIYQGDRLQLTSPLAGASSRVLVTSSGIYAAAATAFGYLTTEADTDTAASPSVRGSGRPNPDFYIDGFGAVQLGAQILRNSLTGIPFGSTQAALYMDFDALRLDVSALSRAKEKLLTIDDQADLEAVLGPISLDNPLGLGMYFALLNSPTVPVHGIGLDEVSAALPDGTVDAYARAADELEAKDIYGIAPLSAEELVHQLFATHVTAMSVPSQRGERILFINPPVPDRAFPTTLASGDANSTATSNELVLDQNPSAGIVAAGLNPVALDAADGVYLEITVNGTFYRYNVSVMNSNLAQFRIVFASGENSDGFYATTALTSSVVDGDYVLKIRGDELLIPGSSRRDLAATARTIAAAANSYSNRRVYYVFPDELTATLDSGSVALPGFYACAAIAGMVGQYNPSTPFSRLPITGFTGVQGSQDTFKPALLDQIAGGGVYILTQQSAGGPVSSRHQLSTDVSTIERRELSITKAVDFVAKYLRNILRNFIGRNNITPQFLDTLSSVVQAQLAFLGTEGLGVIANGMLNTLIQDEAQPDTILVDVQLTVLYPANYIRVTIRV